jgi:enoyl-CoA hydratase
MNDYNTLTTEALGKVLLVRINRPESLNALNIQLIAELKSLLDEVCDNEDVGGIIITGSGDKAFAAGADIKEIAELNEVNARNFAEKGQDVFQTIEDYPKPVFAAVNGYALGGGCELAMACHLRIASANALFGQPEVNLGLIPGYGGTQRLTQIVGKGRALELMLTGNSIDANEAKRIGLANHVEETIDEMIEKAMKLMDKALSKAPLALSMVITSTNAALTSEDGYRVEANSFARCCGTEDFKEGTTAFLEKRKPAFKGK